jgi:hypothetical protein
MFNKAIQLIHSRSLRGRQTRLQRLLFNFLLANAVRQGVNLKEFQADLSLINNAIDYSSKNSYQIVKIICSMPEVIVEWGFATNETFSSSMLAKPIYFASGGKQVFYSFPNSIHQILFFPRIYSRLDLMILKRFSSKYALNLYEWCSRYRNNLNGKTCRLPWQVWQQVLTGNAVGEYVNLDYKIFKRRCLLPSMLEIGLKSDLRVEILEFKKYRSVDCLQFIVTQKLDDSKIIDDLSSALFRRLRKFGILGSEAQRIVRTYPAEKIERCLVLLFERLALSTLPPVDNRTFYLLRLLQDLS